MGSPREWPGAGRPGVSRGHRVAMISSNRPEFVIVVGDVAFDARGYHRALLLDGTAVRSVALAGARGGADLTGPGSRSWRMQPISRR